MRIFFSAGDPSGDQHTALLIDELKLHGSDAVFEGFGGPEMRTRGCWLFYELTQLAVMGFLRVVPLLAQFRRLVKQAEQHFATNPPDAVVLVDFPGFNWWIARAAKRQGIPVFYYLPPQLWAWAPWRLRRVRKWVDHVICALPFEYEWYRSRGVRSTWVGHPFFDEVAAHSLDANVMQALSRTDPDQKMVAVLPGSRKHEVEKNWPVMLQTMQRVSAAVPEIRWVVGSFREIHRQICLEEIRKQRSQLEIEFQVGHASEVIQSADCCLMVSGSISLELLVRNRPGVVLYRLPWTTRMAARVFMNCRFITLTNLIADNELMPEFMSSGNPDRDIAAMADQLTAWLTDGQSLNACRGAMAALAGHAAATGATGRAAELIRTELAIRLRDRTERLPRAA